MASSVRHFGDTADSQKTGGLRFLRAGGGVAQRFRNATRRTMASGVPDCEVVADESQVRRETARELCKNNGMDRDVLGADWGHGPLGVRPLGGFRLREGRETDS